MLSDLRTTRRTSDQGASSLAFTLFLSLRPLLTSTLGVPSPLPRLPLSQSPPPAAAKPAIDAHSIVASQATVGQLVTPKAAASPTSPLLGVPLGAPRKLASILVVLVLLVLGKSCSASASDARKAW